MPHFLAGNCDLHLAVPTGVGTNPHGSLFPGGDSHDPGHWGCLSVWNFRESSLANNSATTSGMGYGCLVRYAPTVSISDKSDPIYRYSLMPSMLIRSGESGQRTVLRTCSSQPLQKIIGLFLAANRGLLAMARVAGTRIVRHLLFGSGAADALVYAAAVLVMKKPVGTAV